MGMLNVNPDAEVRGEFDTVKAGTYAMRVKEVTEETSKKGKEMLKITLSYIGDPASLTNLAGEPCKNPGTLIDYAMTAADQQWKIRQLTEAAGLPWGDYDPCIDLQDKEVETIIKLEAYEGEQRNKVSRYVIPKA